MLLKLIPARQEPTIHFSLSFAELPSNLPTPTSWTAQLAHLMHEDLEVPATLHSLDRAAGIPSLLEEVALDVEMKEVRCRFVDGAVERFTFGLNGSRSEDKLLEALDGIVRDVKESTMEDERVMMERERERQRVRSASVSVVPSAPKPTGKSGKHKKQRSLFMHIVSCVGSIINLTSPSSSTHPSLPFYSRSSSSGSSPAYSSSVSSYPASSSASTSSSSCTSYTPSTPTPGASPRARALRRAARSSLVDTFRRFVLGELVRRFHTGPDATTTDSNYEFAYKFQYHHQRERGGFCVWILHSMRRRALERMEQILEEAGPPGVEDVQLVQQVHVQVFRRASEDSNVFDGLRPTTMDVPLSFSDEEDDEPINGMPVGANSTSGAEMETIETETDGSSLHARSGMPSRRTSSSDSVSTDGSSDSSSTNSSSYSTLTTSTAASSVESESELKDSESPPTPPKDLPSVPFQHQLQPQPSNAIAFSKAPNSNQPQEPSIHHLPPSAKYEYTQLLQLCTRLGQLVQFAASQSRVAADEARNRLEVLAVRSRRRAWLNKALKGPAVKSGNSGTGGSMFGLATPFRSSPLARYVWTAEDLVRKASAASKSTSSSSSSSLIWPDLRSSFSSPSTSIVARPSSRPRLRPKIDYEAALAAAVVELADADNDSDAELDSGSNIGEGDEEQENKFVEHGCEMYEEAKGPSRSRRHHRRRMQDVVLSSSPSAASRAAGRKLFPVSEEMEHEDDEFTLALAVRGRGRGRGKGAMMQGMDRAWERERSGRTFMGCDEIRVAENDDCDPSGVHPEFDDGDADEDADLDLELGFGFHLEAHPHEDMARQNGVAIQGVPSSFDVDMDHLSMEMEMGLNMDMDMERPKARPRVRTTSMMGAFLRGAKGVQRSFGGGSKQLQKAQDGPRQLGGLAADSLLCQPVSIPQPQPQALLKTIPGHAPLPAAPSPPAHAVNRRAMDVSRTTAPSIYTKVEMDMDVDVEMNVQVCVGEYGPGLPLPLSLPKGVAPANINVGMPPEFDIVDQPQHGHAQEEFTLAMDLPRGGARRREVQHEYQPRHWSNRCDFEGGRRPKLGGIFGDGQTPPDGVQIHGQGQSLLPC
ncbi:hypothetical protein BDZ97DRAFT_1275512 [Flammula alnicola]|nr:hypothetical protein BDZ97DRAFT_1275512 [Flammula alnicola]